MAKLRSRLEEPIERMADPCPSKSWAFTIAGSASALGRARNQPERFPSRSPTITVLPPRPNSIAVRGAALTFVTSVSRDSAPSMSQL